MASSPKSISDTVVALLSSNKRIEGIDFAQSAGVVPEELEKWDKREGYALPAGKYPPSIRTYTWFRLLR